MADNTRNDPLVWRLIERAPYQPQEVSDLMREAAGALSYYQDVAKKQRPKWVPARIFVPEPVLGEFPFSNSEIPAGKYDCDCNQWGAVRVRAKDGEWMGVRPNEFIVIAWREVEPS